MHISLISSPIVFWTLGFPYPWLVGSKHSIHRNKYQRIRMNSECVSYNQIFRIWVWLFTSNRHAKQSPLTVYESIRFFLFLCLPAFFLSLCISFSIFVLYTETNGVLLGFSNHSSFQSSLNTKTFLL